LEKNLNPGHGRARWNPREWASQRRQRAFCGQMHTKIKSPIGESIFGREREVNHRVDISGAYHKKSRTHESLTRARKMLRGGVQIRGDQTGTTFK